MKGIYKAIHNPYQVVKMFEEEVANYTGAVYAIAVDSCTNALFLSCLYMKVQNVTIPGKTYLSVPQSIIHAGGHVIFNEALEWEGIYELSPYKIYDAAKRFTCGMYIPESLMCLSFHDKKILPIGKGGMILTDNKAAAGWFKLSRYEGREEVMYHDDDIQQLGYNMYMTPEQAARGLTLMRNIPLCNKDQEEQGGYNKLSKFSVFKGSEVTYLI